MGVFQQYASYYDLMYSDKDYRTEAEYIAGLAKQYKPGAFTMLNLGCGTGKHDVFLKRKGYQITGVDLSEEMIAEAKKQHAGIEFLVGNILDLRLKRKFDLVISLFHVACYQNSDEALSRYFATAAEHLDQGGIFIFDVWNGHAVLQSPPEARSKTAENSAMRIVRKTTPHQVPEKNIIEVNFDFMVLDKATGKKNEFTEKHSMRYLFPEELSIFLSRAGLKRVASEQWMTGKPASADAWYVTYIAKKI